MHQLFVSTAPPPTGRLFTFQSPGISPTLLGQADGNNSALSLVLQYKKSHQGK